LSCATDGNALFMGFDIDARFGPRLNAIRSVLSDFGLKGASFATTGSSEGRGKVITCVAASVPLDLVRRVADMTLRYAQLGQDFGPLAKSSDIGVYPLRDEGGLLRILGRNPKRNGSIEIPLRLSDWEISDLTEITPISAIDLERVVQRFAPTHGALPGTLLAEATSCSGRLHHWAILEIQRSWRWGPDGNPGIMRRVIALAFEFKWAFGVVNGEPLFRNTLERIRQNSPALHLPSPNKKRRRNPLTWALTGKNAWRYACEYRFLKSPAAANAPARIVEVYDELIRYVHEAGIRYYAFNMTYARIAELIGKSHQTAWRLVHDAASIGLLVIHEPGTKRERGKKINTVKLGLVGFGDTQESIRARAQGHSSTPPWYSVASRRRVGSSVTPGHTDATDGA